MQETIYQARLIQALIWCVFAYTVGTHIFLFDGKKTLGPKASLGTRLGCFFASPLSFPVLAVMTVILALVRAETAATQDRSEQKPDLPAGRWF